MSIFLCVFGGLLFIILSRFLFKKWFNHLSVYVLSWSIVLSLYEIKLIKYVDLSSEAWTVIVLGFLAFLLGILIVFAARSRFLKENDISKIRNSVIPPFITDEKLLKRIILVLSVIGLFAAFQHWYVLLQKFGSIKMVIIQANLIYRMRNEGEITGVIPYLYVLSYIGTFFGGIYTAVKNKITFTAVLPIIAVEIKEVASLGRAGMLVGFLEFIIAFFLFRNALQYSAANRVKGKRNFIIAVAVLVLFLVAGATLVKSLRGTYDTFKASSTALKKVSGGEVISPSIYLYASSHVGVLSKYFELNQEHTMWGENTFQPIYNFISKFGVIEHPKVFQKGYYIPMWTNTGTYLREIHADFGYTGLFLVPFLMGLITTFYWFRFYEKKKLIDFVILVYMYITVALSFLVIISRTSIWFISFAALLVFVPLLEKYKGNKTVTNQN